MNLTGYFTEEPATPDYILAVMRDQCNYMNAERYDDHAIELTFDTTIAEWRSTSDLPGTKRLGRGLNAFFGVKLTDSEWRAILDPAKERRLRGVCETIAAKASRRRIRPIRVLGSAECLPAGAFLAIRSLLVEAGANPSDIKPSTRLDLYLEDFAAIFFDQIAALAPGSVPSFRKRSSSEFFFEAAFAAFFITVGLIAFAFNAMGFTYIQYVIIAMFIILGTTFGEIFEPRLELAGLTTFRDLSIAIAIGSNARD